MKIFGTKYQIKFSNSDKKAPDETRIIRQIVAQQIYRTRQDIASWRSGLQASENAYNPNRLPLIRLYRDIELDLHVEAVTGARRDAVLNKPFRVVDKDGTENTDLTKLLKKQWFRDLIEYSVDAKFWGFQLLVLGDLLDMNDKENIRFKEVEVFPREHVQPEFGFVSQYIQGVEGVYFEQPPYSDWWVPVGRKKDLGLFNKIAPAFIYKKNAWQAWSEYCEIFGIPPRIGKTNVRDEKTRKNMENMLANMGSASWGVFDKDDEIELVESAKADGKAVFEAMMRICDEQISKAVLGSTMTTDSAGGQYKGDVHENTKNQKTSSDIEQAEAFINDTLFPLFIRHGFPFKGFRFEYDSTEKLSLMDQAKIDDILLTYYDIPDEFILQTYGRPVTKKEPLQPGALPGLPEGIKNKLQKLYGRGQ